MEREAVSSVAISGRYREWGAGRIQAEILAENQAVAPGFDISLLLDEIEEPGTVLGVAVKHSTDQVVVTDHQFAVMAQLTIL